VAEDWTAVAREINNRVDELGWRQRELAERSQVSPAIVREIQRHTVERRRSPRTLESLSVTLGWPKQYLSNVLAGAQGPESSSGTGETAISARLDAMEQRLAEITRILYGLQSGLATVIEHVRAGQ
jgi:hypothetical protein